MILQAETYSQIFKFVLVGSVVFVVDASLYAALINIVSYSFAKGISYVCGTLTSFFLNKKYTFQNTRSGMFYRFLILYIFSLVVNVGVNYIGLFLTENVTISYIAALSFSIILNFIGQKFWVFK